LRRKQIIFSLSTVFPEFEADLDATIAFGFGTLGFERTVGAVVTLVVMAFSDIPVSMDRNGSPDRSGIGWQDR